MKLKALGKAPRNKSLLFDLNQYIKKLFQLKGYQGATGFQKLF